MDARIVFEYPHRVDARFLFFSGEPATTLPLLQKRPHWSPVLSALKFDVSDGRIHRPRSASDHFRGVVYFADVRDKEIERHNLHQFLKHGVPCWPSPATLLDLSDRHSVLARCVAAGLVHHPVVQSFASPNPRLPFPYVLKVGDEHRGEGKFLIRSARDIPQWSGVGSMEPFFEGDSVRVLILGDHAFGVRVVNDDHWIKNAAGAHFEPWKPDADIVAHARRAADLFGLKIAGVDYVVDAQGFHFIELNPFPRVGLSSESTSIARQMFVQAMERIETLVSRHA